MAEQVSQYADISHGVQYVYCGNNCLYLTCLLDLQTFLFSLGFGMVYALYNASCFDLLQFNRVCTTALGIILEGYPVETQKER